MDLYRSQVKNFVFMAGYTLTPTGIIDTLCTPPRHAVIFRNLYDAVRNQVQRLRYRSAALDFGLDTYTITVNDKQRSWPIPDSMRVAWALGGTSVDEAFVQEIVEWLETAI